MNADVSYILATANAATLGGWQEALSTNSRIKLCRSREGLAAQLAEFKPQQYFLDLSLPGLQGIDDVRKLITAYPRSLCLIFSPIPKDSEGLELLKAGSRAYCNRFIDPSLLRRVTELVAAGEVWVGASIMEQLIRRIPSAESADASEKIHDLTERERDIANRVAVGENNKIIAQQLDITERTVKAHLTSIFQKTGSKDRLQLALLVKGIDSG